MKSLYVRTCLLAGTSATGLLVAVLLGTARLPPESITHAPIMTAPFALLLLVAARRRRADHSAW